MSEQKTQVFYEIHVTTPSAESGLELFDKFGPYGTPRDAKLAKANNRMIRWLVNSMGGRLAVRKITRVYTDAVEEVEI